MVYYTNLVEFTSSFCYFSHTKTLFLLQNNMYFVYLPHSDTD
ncbi:hypothetical protein SAMN06265346_101268 [Flavobacterium hercynium]|nr:hypothetical protein SAMN06265346_101268 [Flavobacterium hercynium]